MLQIVTIRARDGERKGGYWITEEILFGKYQIIGELGSGSTGCVLLAKHLGLNGLRAIKRVPKASDEYGSVLREAYILKELRHSGIPIVYDIEEDSQYGYLIEEYVIGESIFALVNRLGHLEEMMAISYGIQLCQIISYLHSYKLCPILYLDLQPNNIFICDNKLKLIDFNRAMLSFDANNAQMRYGTVGFAAPEQYSDELLDERTDIYAIGMILHYMSSGTHHRCSKEQCSKEQKSIRFGNYETKRADIYQTEHGISTAFQKVIETCLCDKKEERFESVAVLEKHLKEIKEFADNSANYKKSSLIIGFVGSKAGTGTTHLVVSLLSYLYQKNISCLFDEQNSSGMVIKLARYQNIPICYPGELYIFGMPFLPLLGEHVKRSVGSYDVVLKDFGSDIRRAKAVEVHAMVLVAGGNAWEWEECMEAVAELKEKRKFCIVWNHLNPKRWNILPKQLKKETQFYMPYYLELFRADVRRDCFLAELWAYFDLEHVGSDRKRKEKERWKGWSMWKNRRFYGKKAQSIFRKQVGRGGLWGLLRK